MATNLERDTPSMIPGPIPTSAAASSATARTRIDSIDLLRGIVMVVMMLDHTRDFVHYGGLSMDPTNLNNTYTGLFLTRWITHFCAPVFVFLAGTGMYLQFSRGKSKGELSRFLVTRGFWLIVLEFTLVKWGAFFNFDYRLLGIMQVIWVIGASMILMAGLIHLPFKAIAVFGIGMMLLHNLMDGVRVPSWQGPNSPVPSIGAKLWIILHQPFEAFPIAGWPSPVLFVIYPLIPWVGVMATGYVAGALYRKTAEERRKWLIRIGLAAIALFFILRAPNLYGDPSEWATRSSAVFTVLSFINTSKYPPSLLFLLMTLGPALLALAWFESSQRTGPAGSKGVLGWLRGVFVTFGRVPLFFYLLQWPTAKLLSLGLHYLTGKPTAWLYQSLADQTPIPPGVGFRLWVVYACWLLGVVLLYPLCKWFAGVKQRRRDWWLSYL